MSDNRIPYNPSANPNAGTAAKLRQVLSNFQQGRMLLQELARIFAAYNGDFATLATDLGISESSPFTQTQAVNNLVLNAVGDCATTTVGAYSQGGTTFLTQLVNFMG